MAQPSISILGTRGVPAAHGGFETFAEKLSLFLVERGWRVAVYCQEDAASAAEGAASRPRRSQEKWRGVERRIIMPRLSGPMATIEFDLAATLDVVRRREDCLVLGYNTAVFNGLLRASSSRTAINMDGVEWKREKWSKPQQAWLKLNERAGVKLSDVVIADHPCIREHLVARYPSSDPVTIPYGADAITEADATAVQRLGLDPGQYYLMIGRIEPENSILETVQAHAKSGVARRLVCLGTFDPQNPYHREVKAAGASGDVLFPGAIYDKAVVSALRFHARAYCHGHTVGGTNPSLVEAMGAGNCVIAHDNPFNRWVAGPEQLYAGSVEALSACFQQAEGDDRLVEGAKRAISERFHAGFEWNTILEQYEATLSTLADIGGARRGR